MLNTILSLNFFVSYSFKKATKCNVPLLVLQNPIHHVRSTYLKLLGFDPQRFLILNASLFSNGVKNSLCDAIKVFKLPLWDLCTRQSEVLNHLALSPFNELGLALGKGSLKNLLINYSAELALLKYLDFLL